MAGDPASDDRDARRGAFLEDIDKFDARFFGITPIEARMMDPRQRLLLETTWHALEDAGLDSAQLKGTNTGVYAGVTTGDYRDLAAAMGHGHGYLGTTMSVTAGRISFALGLTGPAVPVDLACASSLAAVHQAAAAVRHGEVEMALVGGVNAILWPETTAFMKEVEMLSASGLLPHLRCGGGRVRARRGLRDGRPQAARRCEGRRRPDLGRDSRIRGQPERNERGAHGPERAGPGTRDRDRRSRRRASRRRRWTTSRRTGRDPISGTRSRCRRRRPSTAGDATRSDPS